MLKGALALTSVNSKKCTKCNLEFSSKYRFCSKCGRELKLTNVCPGCNAQLVKNSKFCPDCGASVSQSKPPTTHLTNPEVKSKLRLNNENLIIFLWSIPIISFAYSNYIIDITLGTDSFYLLLAIEILMLVALARNNKDLYKISLLILIGKNALFFIKILSQNNFSFNTLMWPIFVFYLIFIPLLIYIYKINEFNVKGDSFIFQSIFPKKLVVTKVIWFSLAIVYLWYLIIAILSNGFVLGIPENIVLNLGWNALMATVYLFIIKVFQINKRNSKIIGAILIFGFILFFSFNIYNSDSAGYFQDNPITNNKDQLNFLNDTPSYYNPNTETGFSSNYLDSLNPTILMPNGMELDYKNCVRFDGTTDCTKYWNENRSDWIIGRLG
jgi:hypothetical protein